MPNYSVETPREDGKLQCKFLIVNSKARCARWGVPYEGFNFYACEECCDQSEGQELLPVLAQQDLDNYYTENIWPVRAKNTIRDLWEKCASLEAEIEKLKTGRAHE